jgi:hypothetical protein
MVPLTHAAKKDVLLCVFKDILELPDDSSLGKSCAHAGGNDLDTILLFSPLEIEDMQYLVGAVKTHLSKGDRGIIHSLVALGHKRDMEGNFILPDWSNVTLEEYNELRISPEYQSARAGLPNPNAARPGSQVVSSFAKVRDPLSDYRRGVRRDPNAFTALKEDKQWDSWQRGTIAQARAQDLSEMLDSNFVPPTAEATELFVEKQKFFYALFDKVLVTDKGKMLVRQYASTLDAQKVFRDLTVYANASTIAAQEAPDLLTYITSSKFGDGMWKGKAHGFILNWQDKVQQYESILPVKDHLTATIKRKLVRECCWSGS